MPVLTATFVAALAACVTLSEAVPNPKSAIICPITIDGRVAQSTTLQTFDTPASPFNPNYVKGFNLTWSRILRFPDVPPSRFDLPGNKAVEVTISDASVFAPGGGNPQLGFRRAGLLMGNGSDASNVGVQTYHWSVMQPEDKKRRMNLTHEYMNVWHEANDYSSNHFSLNAGTMLEQDRPKEGNVTTTGLDKRLWKVLDRKNNVIWTTRIELDGWQNFGIKIDYEKNTIQVFHSKRNDKLKAVTEPLPNDNTGGGQFQIGIAKKPTETVSVVNDGYQERGIGEGQTYGGIFIEGSGKGCLSK
ncbi:related to endoglucanase c [Rhynchosporium agropyri]|uniref:Related to endoglucanase c n=3 Tax=Rhynchosporium TaxID=38037 RepID=A0A1E1MPG2_RHYSE|nr:related to endoglucanase c [Rhynchosporium agropyri]CZT04993.1 related to endoglucanase c [Rhynchosporium commune]CZT50987.1 related to endoglucanase c [Rhynchosporium secalis]